MKILVKKRSVEKKLSSILLEKSPDFVVRIFLQIFEFGVVGVATSSVTTCNEKQTEGGYMDGKHRK